MTSVVMVRPAPTADPPYEDAPAQPPAGMEMLPVAWDGSGAPDVAGTTPPTVPERNGVAGRDSVALSRGGSVADDAATSGARPASRGPASTVPVGGRPRRLITGQHAARRYVDLCVEVLNGYRPAAQLRPFTEPRRFPFVADQLIRRTTRVRMGATTPRRKHRPVLVKRMVVGEPVEGVAEAAAVLGHGDLVWAMAVRMERQGNGWLCTFAGVL
jgi:hypothetical protein